MTATAHVTATIQLSVDDYTAISARAVLSNVTVAEHVEHLVAQSLSRPEWADISEANAIAAHITALEGQRDRARETAARLEEEENHLRQTVLDELRAGGIIVSAGFLKKLGYDVVRDEAGNLQWTERAL